MREALGLSLEDIARKIDTTRQQLGRIETGERRLTDEWMTRIARVLGVAPGDLLATAQTANDVEPVSDAEIGPDAAVRHRGFEFYRVLSDSVVDAGIAVGDVLTVEQTPEAVARAKSLDILLIKQTEPFSVLLLRVLIDPCLLTTNRPGLNTCFRLDDQLRHAKALGVVIRDGL